MPRLEEGGFSLFPGLFLVLVSEARRREKEEDQWNWGRGKEKRVWNKYAEDARGSFCIFFAFLAHVGRFKIHLSKKGDRVKKRFSAFLGR